MRHTYDRMIEPNTFKGVSQKPEPGVPTPTTAQEVSLAGLGPTGAWFQVMNFAEAWLEMFPAELINIRMRKMLQQ